MTDEQTSEQAEIPAELRMKERPQIIEILNNLPQDHLETMEIMLRLQIELAMDMRDFLFTAVQNQGVQLQLAMQTLQETRKVAVYAETIQKVALSYAMRDNLASQGPSALTSPGGVIDLGKLGRRPL